MPREQVRVTPETTGDEAAQQVMSARSTAWKHIITCDLTKGSLREELYDRARAMEEVRDHFLRGPDTRTVTCDMPGTPGLPVNVSRPAPLLPAPR